MAVNDQNPRDRERKTFLFKTPAGEFPVDLEVWRIYIAHLQRELKARGLPPLRRP